MIHINTVVWMGASYHTMTHINTVVWRGRELSYKQDMFIDTFLSFLHYQC